MGLAASPSTRFVFLAAILAAVGGLLFGYDTGVISGALIFIKGPFHLSTFDQELVVSVVLLGAAVGALSGGKLADAFGRRASFPRGLGGGRDAAATASRPGDD